MAKKLDINKLSPKIVFEKVDKNDCRFIRCKILIVCEGIKTEPNYFKSFDMMRTPSEVVWDVVCDGGGINTIQVVDKAIELRNKAIDSPKPYDSVWAVFDKDSFKDSDFDNAIIKAENNKINCAWSNEAFELWYIYHFDDRSTPMSRDDYKKTITKRVRSHGNKAFTYKKNDPQMRKILSDCGCDEEKAIKIAERQSESFTDKKYHTHNPSTMVYKLVKLLIGKDKEFNKHIKDSLKK